MLTLIGREFRDYFGYIILTGFVSAVIIAVAVLTAWWGMAELGLRIIAGSVVTLLFIFATLGASQMYTDRANRVSSLLATLAVTRSRILAARIVAGAAVILAMLVSLLIAAVAILYFGGMPLAIYGGVIAEVSATMALASLACYCIGLLGGWTTIKVAPVLAIFFGVVAIVLLVVVKGFGLSAIVLLLLFVIMSLLHVWHRFTSVSL